MPPKYGIRKIKMNLEFFDGKKIESRGRYVPEHDSVDFDFIDLNTKKSTIELSDEQCEELSKFFYAMYQNFKNMQGNESNTEWIYDMNEYRKNHDK